MIFEDPIPRGPATAIGVTWMAPQNYWLLRPDSGSQTWIDSILRDQPSESSAQARRNLRTCLEQFTEWAAARSDPDDLHLWIAHIATMPDGQMVINVTGSISFGPAVDVDELAEEWRAAQADSDAVVAEVEVSPSRRAPVVAAREIYLVETEEGEQIYHEWGLAVRSLPRLDMSVRMEIDTPDLAAFDNLTEFLIDSIRNVTLTELEASA